MIKIKFHIYFFMILLISCKNNKVNQIKEQDIQEVNVDSIEDLNSERIANLKSRIKRLQDVESNRKEFLDARDSARKTFESILTEEEKIVICEVREDFLFGIRMMEAYGLQHLKKLQEKNEYTEEVALSYEVQKLKLNKSRNYLISLSDMLPIISGRKEQEIYQLSKKYYNQILRIECQYKDHTKEFYEKNAERIHNDSITLAKIVNKPERPEALILGRMDHTMDFLIVDSNSSSESEIKMLKRNIQLLEKDELSRVGFLKARNKARKGFEKRLTDSEKHVINKVRQSFLSFRKSYEEIVENEFTQEAEKNKGKLSEELKLRIKEHELKKNKWNNYLFDRKGIFLPRPRRGDKTLEDIFTLSNKYYIEILRVESKYSDQARKDYEENAKKLRHDSIIMATEDEYFPSSSLGMSRQKTDYSMEFLIIDSN